MSVNDLREQAVNLLKNASGINTEMTPEEMEDQLPLWIWMFRQGIERKKIEGHLATLIDTASQKAARAIIELSKTAGEEETDTKGMFERVTSGKT